MDSRRKSARLTGWYVISLRPVGQHAAPRRAAAAHGARLFACSPLRLAAVPDDGALAAALAAPRVIFTSPAAVRFAAAQARLGPRAGARWYAVGAGTAAALRRAGVAGVMAPTRMDSEGLLALPGLDSVAGLDVGLVTAPGGRGTIAATLTRRGARVRVARVYRREAVRLTAATRARLAALPPPRAVLVSSGEAFAGFWSQLDARQQRTLATAVFVASSERLAAMLRGHGLRRVLVADSARPRALLERLAAHAATTAFG
ncbi:uroporphyrinogen-III synthase [Rehaibacterium terrae]|uniref:Uroporphyrinogen-III synthase n=1 Tax=Rehaibacterium terrae TaxID=1341696 RepID=A0A7W7Y124_9GAMM|nr:uroporphyrinogen-III synthase [Rehaibacterium terrae]MBB5016132.1 uroporphyrinogen-III synthase [Rehaibacterium terrae]